MLKYVFDSLQLTEFQITPKAIKRLRIAALMGVPTVPCFAAMKFLNLPSITDNILSVIGFVSLLALFYVALSRIANRFYSPNRYLDEWEINKKEAANSFAFQFLILGMAGVILTFGLIMFMGGQETITLDYTKLLWVGFYAGILGMLAQFIHLIFSLESLEDVEGPKTAEVKAQDRRWYGVAASILICVTVLGLLGGSIIPLAVSNAADRATAQCGQGNVKSVSTKGLFKSEIRCFEESIRKP